jgi:hypothetical protein
MFTVKQAIEFLKVALMVGEAIVGYDRPNNKGKEKKDGK